MTRSRSARRASALAFTLVFAGMGGATAATVGGVPTAARAAVTEGAARGAAQAADGRPSISVRKIANVTVKRGGKATLRPRVVSSGRIKVVSVRLTVKVGESGSSTVVRNKAKAKLGAGTYRVTTKVRYRTYTTRSGAKVWSGIKSRSRMQVLTIKTRKAPSVARPIAGGECPAATPIKGNQSGIYHVPRGAYYERTIAEECFGTEKAARAAGYRASKR